MPDTLLQVRDVLRDAVSEVLQKMFFIRILQDPQAASAHRQWACHGATSNEIAAWVNFHGDPSGALLLRLDRHLARTIAADFLGEEEPELAERQVEEVAGELANMVCGAVLSHIESTASFRLDTPRSVDPCAADNVCPETARHIFPIGDGELTVKLWMEEPVCGPADQFAS